MRASSAIAVLGMLLGTAAASRAEPRAFDFKDPKGVNAITIRVDSLLEPIVGVAGGVSGTLTFDPEKPEATTGTIVVDAASISMWNPVMTKTLHSKDWLDVTQNPTVRYAIKKVTAVTKTGDAAWDLTVAGAFTLKGTTQDMEVTISASHLPGRYGERNHKGSGDLLVLRCDFQVDRKAFDIKPDVPAVTVGQMITLGVGIVGGATNAPAAGP